MRQVAANANSPLGSASPNGLSGGWNRGKPADPRGPERLWEAGGAVAEAQVGAKINAT